MESIVITWRELLIVVALILAVYIAEMLFLMRTGEGVLRKRRAPEQRNDELLSQIRNDVADLNTRIVALERYIQQLQTEESDTEATPYSRAIQMARQGRDASRISESCGISRGEAELIISMHGPHE